MGIKRSRYTDFTVDIPDAVKPQTKTSCSTVKNMAPTWSVKSNYCVHFVHGNVLQKEMFKAGALAKISATETFFR